MSEEYGYLFYCYTGLMGQVDFFGVRMLLKRRAFSGHRVTYHVRLVIFGGSADLRLLSRIDI
jgi:hypothetical protein